MIDKYIVYKLCTNATVSGLVGKRVVPLLNDADVYPVIVYETSAEAIVCMGETARAFRASIQVTGWAQTPSEAAAVGKAIESALDSQSEVYDNIDIDSIFVTDSQTMIDTAYEPVTGSSRAGRLYGYQVELTAFYSNIG